MTRVFFTDGLAACAAPDVVGSRIARIVPSSSTHRRARHSGDVRVILQIRPGIVSRQFPDAVWERVGAGTRLPAPPGRHPPADSCSVDCYDGRGHKPGKERV